MAIMAAAQGAGCRVLLTGHFGDVLFEGADYWAAEMLRELRFGQLLSTVVGHRSRIEWRHDLFESGVRPLLPTKLRLAYRRRRPRSVRWRNPGLHPDLVKRTGLEARSTRDQRWKEFPAPGHWSRYRSLTSASWPQGAAAVRSLHNRHHLEQADPYWDRRLLEFVMALPADQLGRPGRTRWVQRNALVGLLPEAVRERRGKTHFHPLLVRGLRKQEQSTVRMLLQDSQIVRRRFVRPDWLQTEFQADGGWTDYGYWLWLFISLEIWLRHYWQTGPQAAKTWLEPEGSGA
jgi:asparagine synthase (glutamine-hydrolysing)